MNINMLKLNVSRFIVQGPRLAVIGKNNKPNRPPKKVENQT